jgi:sec-independent protein translocase protein TatA
LTICMFGILDPSQTALIFGAGDPFQILLILAVVAVLLIWGPQKIPELARSIGRARREFDDASKGIVQQATNPTPSVASPDALVETAQRLGIETKGKTRQEISDEIVKQAQK